MSLPVAILCGGFGTRLGELTRNTPKSLVEVAGEPFIAHQLRLLAKAGLTDVVLLVGHFGEDIARVVGEGKQYGVTVRYSSDGPTPLGVSGAIQKAWHLLGGASFVLYGDSYLECDYAAIEQAWRESGKAGLRTLCQDGGKWVDYGLSILTPQAGPLGPFVFYKVPGRYYEIGSPEGLAETRAHLASRNRLMPFTVTHLGEMARLLDDTDWRPVERMAEMLSALKRRGGRLFILGNGGSAANASHAVNDFRKIAGIEAYAPTDNVAELTARANDEGWPSVLVEWLKGSRLTADDMVCVFSVGGGSDQTSPNLVRALDYAKSQRASITGIVGRDGGYTAKVADCCVLVPTVSEAMVAAHTEAMQAVIWHLLANHPALATKAPQKAAGTRQAVFLDRDGTLIDEQTHAILPGVPEALARLRKAGYLLIMVTNQPDIARGKRIEEQVRSECANWCFHLGVTQFYLCPHDDADHCDCRKPKPGLILQAAKDYHIDLSQSIMVGDSWRDVAAGGSVGCWVFLIGQGTSLKEAADWILGEHRQVA